MFMMAQVTPKNVILHNFMNLMNMHAHSRERPVLARLGGMSGEG